LLGFLCSEYDATSLGKWFLMFWDNKWSYLQGSEWPRRLHIPSI
jgi:hypothetical protein